jgi:phytoene/squalene synthetase
MKHEANEMSYTTFTSHGITTSGGRATQRSAQDLKEPVRVPDASQAASITRKASSQTYYTIRFLVDRPLVDDAFRAYAYFRWVDDTLDQGQMDKTDRLAYLARQLELIDRCYRGEQLGNLCPEERLIVELIHSDPAENSSLRTYINQMMAVMAFDASRQGRLITRSELNEYSCYLATAVTEALHYFIGHNQTSPQDHTRYSAVTGAHITHMLRDTIEDAANGYYNIPQEHLDTHCLTPENVDHEAYRAWVQDRVLLARNYFSTGRSYLARVGNRRCRLAGYAYIARFEVVLEAIEGDGYRLRADYPERKSKKTWLKMSLEALGQALLTSRSGISDSFSSLMPPAEVTTEVSR